MQRWKVRSAKQHVTAYLSCPLTSSIEYRRRPAWHKYVSDMGGEVREMIKREALRNYENKTV